MNPKNFFGELKRRNVYKVAVAYAVVGWLLIQIGTQVFPFFEVPNWGIRLIVLLIVAGFPIALILAWAFELTPGGNQANGRCRPCRAGRLAKAKVDLCRHYRRRIVRRIVFSGALHRAER
jgi:hypothetical protein